PDHGEAEVGEEGDRLFEVANSDADVLKFDGHADHASQQVRQRAVSPYAPTYAARCSPVSVDLSATNCAGVPSNTTRPPSCPAPGPRSMIQSACTMTAWWCSITMTDLPESTSRS